MIAQARKLASDELRNETMCRAFQLAAMLPQSAWKHPGRPKHRKRHKQRKHGNG